MSDLSPSECMIPDSYLTSLNVSILTQNVRKIIRPILLRDVIEIKQDITSEALDTLCVHNVHSVCLVTSCFS